MKRVGLIGPGAIGGTIGAWLAREHALVVGARSPFEKLEVDTPFGTLVSRPVVLTDPAQASPVDWLLCATKVYDVPEVAPWLARFRRSETPLAVLQNGVEHVERFAAWVPRERILPVVVDCSAERVAGGKIVQHGSGTLWVPAGPLGREFVQLFSHARLTVAEHEDFVSEAWRKLCLNSAGAAAAVLAAPTRVARHEGVADLVRGVVRECILVGRAEGAVLDDALADAVVEHQKRAPLSSYNSMTRDRCAGRPMEIDARNGVVVRFGKRHGIPTPLNALLVALLEAVQGMGVAQPPIR